MSRVDALQRLRVVRPLTFPRTSLSIFFFYSRECWEAERQAQLARHAGDHVTCCTRREVPNAQLGLWSWRSTDTRFNFFLLVPNRNAGVEEPKESNYGTSEDVKYIFITAALKRKTKRSFWFLYGRICFSVTCQSSATSRGDCYSRRTTGKPVIYLLAMHAMGIVVR